MILEALNQYYETLCSRGELSVPGWNDAFKVSFGLDLSENGELLRVIDLREEKALKNRTVSFPKLMRVPAHPTRTSGTLANFLCDNSSYILGIDGKGRADKALCCFVANKELHKQLLSDVDEPAARAILAFFSTWDPDEALTHPVLESYLETILSGVNLIFCYDGSPVSESEIFQDVWQKHYDASDPFAPKGICLVTGQIAPIAPIHPMIKGIKGAQPTGAALVSFNAPAFCSYGHKQNYNAPVSERAAFAYTTALNTLIADRDHCKVIGDTTIVCWAEHGDHSYQDAYLSSLSGVSKEESPDLLKTFLNKIGRGEAFEWDGNALDENEHFYILGLSPNAARLSVRFFYKDSFGSILRNIQKHYEDITIAVPAYDPREHISLWGLLSETVNENSRSKDPSPQLAGEVLRSILDGTPYPATLLNGVMQRIRADRKVTRGRAAIIKGYYLRSRMSFPKEVLTVEVNKESTSVPYILGRLFSVYEQIQDRANPDLNATIRDKFYNSAACTPARVFPILNNKAQFHLRKIRRTNPGTAIYYEKMLGELSCKIGPSYPVSMSIADQGQFHLGWYHENQVRYTPKENKTVEE